MKKKPWRDMTEKEVQELKNRQCKNCIYHCKSTSAHVSTCDYILINRRRRPCSPLECVEKGVYRPVRLQRMRKKERKRTAEKG